MDGPRKKKQPLSKRTPSRRIENSHAKWTALGKKRPLSKRTPSRCIENSHAEWTALENKAAMKSEDAKQMDVMKKPR